MPVQKGNVLLIASDIDNTHRVTVKWQQMFSDKTADYYTIVAKNKSQGESRFIVDVACPSGLLLTVILQVTQR